VATYCLRLGSARLQWYNSTNLHCNGAASGQPYCINRAKNGAIDEGFILKQPRFLSFFLTISFKYMNAIKIERDRPNLIRLIRTNNENQDDLFRYQRLHILHFWDIRISKYEANGIGTSKPCSCFSSSVSWNKLERPRTSHTRCRYRNCTNGPINVR